MDMGRDVASQMEHIGLRSVTADVAAYASLLCKDGFSRRSLLPAELATEILD
jgi:hypothetical protein